MQRRMYHAKEVSGNAKHVQNSTADSVFGFCEATFHSLDLSLRSKLSPFATKMQLAARDAEERIQAKIANVRR